MIKILKQETKQANVFPPPEVREPVDKNYNEFYSTLENKSLASPLIEHRLTKSINQSANHFQNSTENESTINKTRLQYVKNQYRKPIYKKQITHEVPDIHRELKKNLNDQRIENTIGNITKAYRFISNTDGVQKKNHLLYLNSKQL